MELDADQLREFAHRERRLVQDLRSDHWRSFAARHGVVAGLRIGEALRRQYRERHPEWPTQEDREADLAVHMRVSRALQSVRPAGG